MISEIKKYLKNSKFKSPARRIYYIICSFLCLILSFLNAQKFNAYKEKHNKLKLHIGCGKNQLKGWLNTDAFEVNKSIYIMNAVKPFPFDTNTFDFVYSEHMIEHVLFDNAHLMLSEIHRVLKPNGVLRISTPDLERIMALHNPKSDLEKNYINDAIDNLPHAISNAPGYVINSFVRDWGHIFIYDKQTIFDILNSIGFEDINFCDVGKSKYDDLMNIESHGQIFSNPEFNKVESMVVEATKPGYE